MGMGNGGGSHGRGHGRRLARPVRRTRGRGGINGGRTSIGSGVIAGIGTGRRRRKRARRTRRCVWLRSALGFGGQADALGCVMQKHKSGGAVGHHQWGKYGIINVSECVSSLGLDGYFPSSSGVSDGYMRCSLYNKEQEFRAWLVEERKINPETITKDQTKKEFARFTEDYNTGECSGCVTVCLKTGSSWWCQR